MFTGPTNMMPVIRHLTMKNPGHILVASGQDTVQNHGQSTQWGYKVQVE